MLSERKVKMNPVALLRFGDIPGNLGWQAHPPFVLHRYCVSAFYSVGLFFFCLVFFFFFFLQIEGLWGPCIEWVCWCHFSISICSLCISVSRFCTSHNIPDIFIIIFVMVIRDQWPLLILYQGLHRRDLGTGVDEKKDAGDPSLEWNKGTLFAETHAYISSYKAASGSLKKKKWAKTEPSK